jgi:Family of unknown function (DUF6152)
MRQQLIACLAGGFLAGAGGVALAHHSFAMFDTDNPTELVGEVQEFRFTSPHTFIILRVKGTDGNVTVWSLEGQSPSALVRDGWSGKAINSGDQVIMTIAPLRSGAPGGAWTTNRIKFQDGRPIVVGH